MGYSMAEIKLMYAKALLYNKDAYEAALEVVEGKVDHAKKLATFRFDREVVKILNELREEKAREIPTKEEMLSRLSEISMNPGTRQSDKINAIKTMAEIQGYIIKIPKEEKKSTSNRVMLVKDMGDEQDWENKCKNQQRNLIDAG